MSSGLTPNQTVDSADDTGDDVGVTTGPDSVVNSTSSKRKGGRSKGSTKVEKRNKEERVKLAHTEAATACMRPKDVLNVKTNMLLLVHFNLLSTRQKKNTLCKTKETYLKEKPPSPKIFVSTGIIPIVNKTWPYTLGSPQFARKALFDRGWTALNYILLDDPRLISVILISRIIVAEFQ